jgi:uncharacterized protein
MSVSRSLNRHPFSSAANRTQHKIVIFIFLASCAMLLSGCASLADSTPRPTQALPRVELPNTFVHELPTENTGHKHQVWVHLPSTYEQNKQLLPVVFVTDAGYSFPLIRSIRNRIGKRGQNLEEFILVGLPHEPGIPPNDSRSRDYTPTNPLLDPNRTPGNYVSSTYGQANAYRDYIEKQVFPLIEKHYRADLKRAVYMGQSYGGLFGAYVLLTKPEMFHTYLLGSPSFWFDKRSILPIEAAYATSHKDMKARVKMYTGSYETIKPGPRYPTAFDLTADMLAFETLLKSRRYPNLSIASEVLDDEDHLTMGPDFVTRSLLWALPGHGPYNGE